jgi:hypothetical protein
MLLLPQFLLIYMSLEYWIMLNTGCDLVLVRDCTVFVWRVLVYVGAVSLVLVMMCTRECELYCFCVPHAIFVSLNGF